MTGCLFWSGKLFNLSILFLRAEGGDLGPLAFGSDKSLLQVPQTLTFCFNLGTSCLYFKQAEQKEKPQFGQAFSRVINPNDFPQVLQDIFCQSEAVAASSFYEPNPQPNTDFFEN